MINIETSAGYRYIPAAKKKMQVTYNYLKHTSKGKFRQWTIENLNSALIKELKKLNLKTVLDAGCGEGFTLERLRKENIASKYVGFDGSSIAVKLGEAIFPKLIIKNYNIG